MVETPTPPLIPMNNNPASNMIGMAEKGSYPFDSFVSEILDSIFDVKEYHLMDKMIVKASTIEAIRI
jgi:hypothetical protein